jgi:hypothetical protein
MGRSVSWSPLRQITPARCAAVTALLALLTGFPAAASICSLDDRPGASLLLPYFEVNLNDPNGLTTLFSVNNATDKAVLTNVVLWTDLGVPTLSFQVYLTGYDVQTINLRDIFAGNIPPTASSSQAPQDVISPKGLQSQDSDYASCSGVLPADSLSSFMRFHLRTAHTGLLSPFWGLCAGQRFNDGLARGYITIDTVSRCSSLVPGDAGYFGPGGVATHDNVLWGDFFYVDPPNFYADGENLVRLKSDPVFFAGKRTFYGRFVNGSGADGRQPLAPNWATRFLSPTEYTGHSDLIVWRDSGQLTQPFTCGQAPSWYPLVLSSYIAFNEQEEPFIPQPLPIDPPPPLPLPTQLPAVANRLKVGTEPLPTPFEFGWIYLHLGQFHGSAFDPSQGWVGVRLEALGGYSAGYGTTPLSSGCLPAGPQNAPVP